MPLIGVIHSTSAFADTAGLRSIFFRNTAPVSRQNTPLNSSKAQIRPKPMFPRFATRSAGHDEFSFFRCFQRFGLAGRRFIPNTDTNGACCSECVGICSYLNFSRLIALTLAGWFDAVCFCECADCIRGQPVLVQSRQSLCHWIQVAH